MPTLVGLVILIGALIVSWFIASLPAYLAGKAVTDGRATIRQAIGATLGGVIVFGLTVVVIGFFVGSVMGLTVTFWATVFGFVAFLGVYKSAFHTGWLGALAIAVISVFLLLMISLTIGTLFGVSFPASLPHHINT